MIIIDFLHASFPHHHTPVDNEGEPETVKLLCQMSTPPTIVVPYHTLRIVFIKVDDRFKLQSRVTRQLTVHCFFLICLQSTSLKMSIVSLNFRSFYKFIHFSQLLIPLRYLIDVFAIEIGVTRLSNKFESNDHLSLKHEYKEYFFSVSH